MGVELKSCSVPRSALPISKFRQPLEQSAHVPALDHHAPVPVTEPFTARAIELILWTKPTAGKRYLPLVNGRLDGPGAPIYVRPDWKNKRMGPKLKGELFFTAPLKDVLGESYGSAVDGITDFANRVLIFARDGGTVVSE